MNLQEILLELRRNPKSNIKVSGHRAAANFISTNWKNHAIEEYGISMTDIPKLGINPGSHYNTPLGIYFYPASYYLEKKLGKNYKQVIGLNKHSVEELDYKDDAQYIQILKFNTNNILEIDLLDVTGYKEYISRLMKSIGRVAQLIGDSEISTTQLMIRLETKSHSLAKVNSYGGQLWYILWQLSQNVLSKNKGYNGEKASRETIIWNHLFRLIGVDIVIDNGSGIIHDNEPCQGVVLNPRSIQHVDTIRNIVPFVPLAHDEKDNIINTKTINTKDIPNAKLYIVTIEYYTTQEPTKLKTQIVKVYAKNDSNAENMAYHSLDTKNINVYTISTTKK